MGYSLRLAGLGLLVGIAACSSAPAGFGPSPPDERPAGLRVPSATREVQQAPRPWIRPYTSWRDRRLARAHYYCGNAYQDCLARDQAAHPGAQGSLFGGSPEGRAACEREMNACYARHGITTPPQRSGGL